MSILFNIHTLMIASFLLPIPFPVFGVLISVGYGLLNKTITPLKWAKEHPIITSFFILSLLTSLIASNQVGIVVTIAIYIFHLYMLQLRPYLTTERFHDILKLFQIGSWLYALISFLQVSFNLFIFDYTKIHPLLITIQDTRGEGIFFYSNYYAMMTVFFILITFYLLLKGQNKIFSIATIIVNCIGLAYSQSRTALLALIFSSLVFLWVVLPKEKKHLFQMVLIALIFLSPLAFLLPRFDFVKIIVDLIEIRVPIWKVSLEHFSKTFVIGSGPLTYMTIYDKYGSFSTEHAHNLFLDALLNYGVIGATLLSVVLFKLFKKAKYTKDLALNALLTSSLILVLTHGLLDVTILFIHTLFMFTFIFAYHRESY